jgi:hypothetical protein
MLLSSTTDLISECGSRSLLRLPFCSVKYKARIIPYSVLAFWRDITARAGPLHSGIQKLKKNQQEDICSLFLLLAARLSDQLIADAVL